MYTFIVLSTFEDIEEFLINISMILLGLIALFAFFDFMQEIKHDIIFLDCSTSLFNAIGKLLLHKTKSAFTNKLIVCSNSFI